MKFTKLNPKRFFKSSKDPSTVSKSGSSFGSSTSTTSSSSSSDPKNNHPVVVVVTPTNETSNTDSSSYVEILKAFKLLDKDNDGVLSRHDLESLLSQLGPVPLTKEEINVMLREVDRDGDGNNIRLEDLASRVVSLDPESDELKEAFEFFDVDGDGMISAKELLRVFGAVVGDEKCTLEECERMIAAVDDDGNGFVCFNEFSKMMMDLHR